MQLLGCVTTVDSNTCINSLVALIWLFTLFLKSEVLVSLLLGLRLGLGLGLMLGLGLGRRRAKA